MERRTFVGLLLTAATTGCLHGGDEENETETPEQAEFGLKEWVPTGRYRSLTYLDYTTIREHTSLGKESIGLVEGAEIDYTDVDELISARLKGEGGFEAYSGSFDSDTLSDSVVDALEEAGTEEHRGYTVVRRSGEGNGEIALSDESIVVGTGSIPTEVVDVSVGEGAAHAETDDRLANISEYTQNPFALTVKYDRFTNVIYKVLDEEEDRLSFVEVLELPTEEDAQDVYENYTVEGDDFVRTERDGRVVSISSGIGSDGIEGMLNPNQGQFPRWTGQAQENKI